MPFTRQIGQLVGMTRRGKGVTQARLGERLGLKQQQIHRYEKGDDHISASRLHEIALALEVDTGRFFPPRPGAGAETTSTDNNSLEDRLLFAFASIRGKDRRVQVVDMIETYARKQMSDASRYKQLFCW
jgi:transcriptional regulator with XRE-family HTH domain